MSKPNIDTIADTKKPQQYKVLIVDDEPAIREMLELVLAAEGFHLLVADSAQKAHELVVDEQPDIILLDWMMPGVTGLEFLRRLRRSEMTATIPVILITAKTEEDSRVAGLDSGADDYITKPFAPRELISRIYAILRRINRIEMNQVIEFEQMLFDPASYRVQVRGMTLDLGPTEFRLLQFFLKNQDRVYNRDQIMDHVWGGNVYLDERTVDVHILRLRKALSEHSYDKYIQTVRGVGYRFSNLSKGSVKTT